MVVSGVVFAIKKPLVFIRSVEQSQELRGDMELEKEAVVSQVLS